jgi:hypothetical protein
VDGPQFDRLVERTFGAAASRRTALQGLAAGLLGAAGLAVSETEAKKRHRRKRHNNRCGAQYAGCDTGRDCCEGLICKKLENPSAESAFSGTCAYKRGCGKKNNYCDKNRDCCRRFKCKGHKCKRRT